MPSLPAAGDVLSRKRPSSTPVHRVHVLITSKFIHLIHYTRQGMPRTSPSSRQSWCLVSNRPSGPQGKSLLRTATGREGKAAHARQRQHKRLGPIYHFPQQCQLPLDRSKLTVQVGVGGHLGGVVRAVAKVVKRLGCKEERTTNYKHMSYKKTRISAAAFGRATYRYRQGSRRR